jgi:hypothetical protein
LVGLDPVVHHGLPVIGQDIGRQGVVALLEQPDQFDLRNLKGPRAKQEANVPNCFFHHVHNGQKN